MPTVFLLLSSYRSRAMDVHGLAIQDLLELLPDQNLQLFDQTPRLISFHSFAKLPIELRNRIWDLARARNVLVFMDKHQCLRSKTPTPVTFRINLESRKRLYDTTFIHSHCTTTLRTHGSRCLHYIDISLTSMWIRFVSAADWTSRVYTNSESGSCMIALIDQTPSGRWLWVSNISKTFRNFYSNVETGMSVRTAAGMSHTSVT